MTETKKIIDEKYEIIRELKRGGFGRIYEGVDLVFDKKVAIKAIEPALLGEAKYIDMFQAEALSIARLSHHNIVSIYDIRRDADNQFYIIMEFIDGPDLYQLLRACKQQNMLLPRHLGVHVIAEVCSGLDYAHNRRDSESNKSLNLVHLDISPSNIMINRSGEIKIIDFGMANFRRQRPGKKNEVVIQGKLNYLAPEQLNGAQKLDRRVDIFALGLVLYEVIAGERFFKTTNPQEIIEIYRSGKIDFSPMDRLDLPLKLQTALKRALEPSPEKRYASASQMYMDLMHYLIMAAPAADFMKELAEFIEKMQPITGWENNLDKTSGQVGKASAPVFDGGKDSDLDSPPNDHNDGNATSPPQPGSVLQGESKTKSAAAKDSAVLLDISDDAVAEIESQQANQAAQPEPVVLDASAAAPDFDPDDTVTDEKIPRQDKASGRKRSSRRSRASQKKKEKPVQTPAATQEPAKGKPENQQASKSQKQATPDIEKGPIIKIVEQEKAPEPEPSTDYFSILEEPGEDDELKTIIDVVKLSARTHKKAISMGAAALLGFFLLFMVVDTFARWTPLGTGVYDYLYPPAIKIVSVPPGAQVYLDDKPLQQTTPLSIPEITPGVHKLMLTMSRFDPIVKSIHVPRKGQLKVAGEKSRHPSEPFVFRFKAQLELSSQPTEATIFINDVKLTERTPATVFWEIGAEPIRIRMSYPGLPDLQGLEIEAISSKEHIEDRRFWRFQKLDRIKDHFAIEGVFRKGIEIKSIPSRAEIYIDESERPAGETGLNGTVLLTIGQHVITLRKNGYLPKTFSLTVDENSQIQVTELLSRNVRLFARDAATGDANDIGARLVELRTRNRVIKMNERTPATITLLPYRYTAVLQKPGYQDILVQIRPGQRTVAAKLKKLPARVALMAVDSRNREPVVAAEVYYKPVQGSDEEIPLGVTDENGMVITEIPPGRYHIRIDKRGYEAKSKILNMRGNSLNRFTFQLNIKQ